MVIKEVGAAGFGHFSRASCQSCRFSAKIENFYGKRNLKEIDWIHTSVINHNEKKTKHVSSVDKTLLLIFIFSAASYLYPGVLFS